MDLIVKPTQRCNFSCSYCSSTDIAKSNSVKDDLSIDKIFKFLNRYPDTNHIILNGGDPLVVKVSFFEQLIQFIEDKKLKTKIEINTNLWDFYKKPEKWIKIFKNPIVKVGTSFEFGNARLITKDKYLTKNLFLDIIYKFESYFNYRPDYISVITTKNISTALDNVRLAKELGVQCKLNYVVKSGKVDCGLSIGEMHHLYLEIINEALDSNEDNSRRVLQKINGFGQLICPHSRDCDEGIRNLQPLSESGYEYGSCGAFGDDQRYGIDFETEMNGEKVLPLRGQKELQYMKEECLSCENFLLCNGCFKTIIDHKESNLVESSCKSMKEFRKLYKDKYEKS